MRKLVAFLGEFVSVGDPIAYARRFAVEHRSPTVREVQAKDLAATDGLDGRPQRRFEKKETLK